MPAKTYFFDITDILMYVEHQTTVSGIQRVSFEVINRAITQLGADVVRLGYWDKRKQTYMAVEPALLNTGTGFSPQRLAKVFFNSEAWSDRHAPTLIRYRKKPLKYRFHRMMRTYHAWRGNDAHFQRRGSSLEEWHAFDSNKPPEDSVSLRDLNPIAAHEIAKSGDPLIILGAIWDIEGLYDALQDLRDVQGMDVTQLVHDLIPLVMPEHIADDFSHKFHYWLETSLDYCTRYYANSESTARDLARFMAEAGQELPIEVVPLARHFADAPAQQTKISAPTLKSYLDDIKDVDRSVLNLTKMPYVLVVGTMETRKNAWRLAQVWQRLGQDRDINVPKLVFAGKSGWYNTDFDALMNATGNLGGWVQMIDGPSDNDLQFLYKNCLFTAMVSYYEGWGLPIGEGLSFGKTGVVADNSSMPEVGGDMVEYCDAQSIDSIYAACRRLIEDVDHRTALEARIADTTSRTWDDVAADVVRLVQS